MLTRTLPPHGQGGLAAAGLDLAQALARAGAAVRVMTPGDPVGPGDPGGDAPAGVEIRSLPAPVGRYSRAWWRSTLEAYDQFGPDRFDVVLGVSAAANALAARSRPPRPVFVFQAHGTSAGEIASKLQALRPRSVPGLARSLYWGAVRDQAYRDYDAVVAVGEAVRRQLAAWPTRALVGDTPVHLIRNGVDTSAFRFDPQARQDLRAGLRLPQPASLALFAGRLQADKGPLRALEAFRRASPLRPDLHLAFAGDGPERDRLERRVATLGLRGRVHLLGALPRPDLGRWLSAADALLFPTRRAEGLPLVVLEALACALPVLTTPQGAGDGELACRRFDACDLDAFAEALVQLQPSDSRASRLPQAFHLDHSARAHLALFERLLGDARLAA